MTEELLPGARIPSVTLDLDKATHYTRAVRRALRAARLNTHYPDTRRLAEHIDTMDPAVHGGLYAELQIDVRTGLPTYREWTRVQTDVALAAGQLAQLGPRDELARKAQGAADIWRKQLLKRDYYATIVDRKISPLGEMSVALRRVDRERRSASFHVELDKLDASGVFVRYVIDLAQSGHGEGPLSLDSADVARQSEEFQALIYKFTSLDSEFTFVKLASIAAVTPERVCKGVVGPFWFEYCRVPQVLRPVVADGGFVASFALDTAAIDVAEGRNNDPFATLAEDRLTEQSRSAYEAVRLRSGYRVFKDRKFVVPRDRVSMMREICQKLGTKNIIYGV